MRDRAISANYATSLPSRPPGVVLRVVPAMANVMSVDPISPLDIQNSNAFNGFLPLLGAFGLCSHRPHLATIFRGFSGLRFHAETDETAVRFQKLD